ncbi:MAG: TlpA family protein disulfide reductase [Hydrocarboniphaga effusa]|nr:TlpA family protein disulfide reductase [Hydrocarboniphaga effusa]
MSLRGSLALLALCLASAAGGISAYRFWQAGQTAAAPVEIRPDLQFNDLSGAPHKLSEWNGKLLLLNFWATWCTPCLKEIPQLIEAQKTHAARGLQVVGLALDKPEAVRQFRDRFGINYPLMVGETDIVSGMDALGDTLGAFPFSVLIAPDGRILDRNWGDLSHEELEELLGKYL